MMKMYVLCVAALALGSTAWFQASSAQFVKHSELLQAAQGLTIKFTVQELPGSAKDYTLIYSRPGCYRLDSPDGFALCNGKQIWSYKSATNTYTEGTVDEKGIAAKTQGNEVWAWAPFFDKTLASKLKSAKLGAKRNMKGNMITELSVTLGEDRAITVFIDDKLGIARGLTTKTPKGDIIVVASAITLADKPLESSFFNFVAPRGATLEVAPVKLSASWKEVSAVLSKRCMPCHSSENRKSGVDLSSYDQVLATGGVTPGDPDHSRLVRAINGSGRKKMPPPPNDSCTTEELQLVSDWIKDGAKN